MKRTKSSKVSVTDVAHAAGVSKATASNALQTRPSVNKATRERVQRIARTLGYTPDPRMAAIMACVQGATTKDLLPIAWLNTHTEEDAWHKYKFLSPYIEGARARAAEFGYRLEEFWVHKPGLTRRRLSQIIYSQGIEGAVATEFIKHLRLNWDSLASVSLEGGLLAPRLDRVMPDMLFNFMLALKMVRRFGYRRVGICLHQDADANSAHSCRAAAHYFQASAPGPDQVEPLFYPWGKRLANEEAGRQMAIAWIRRHKPDVVVGLSNQLVDFVEKAGYRVPEEVGVVHLATDDDVSDWAGIHSYRRELGRIAVGRVINLLRNRQFGVPQRPEYVMIRGTWHSGRTLLLPKLR